MPDRPTCWLLPGICTLVILVNARSHEPSAGNSGWPQIEQFVSVGNKRRLVTFLRLSGINRIDHRD